MSDQSLLMLLDEVRGKTLRLLQSVTDDETRWSPPELHNHILWHAGHSFVLVESLITEAAGELPQIPEGWFEIFSWKSNPAQVASYRWPPLAQIIVQLTEQQGRLRRVIERPSEEQLSRPLPGRGTHTARYVIIHGLHDEACHSGEIWLLRKLIRSSVKEKTNASHPLPSPATTSSLDGQTAHGDFPFCHRGRRLRCQGSGFSADQDLRLQEDEAGRSGDRRPLSARLKGHRQPARYRVFLRRRVPIRQ